jgi:hypothetical protein
MVHRLVSTVADCETGNSSRLAASGLEGVLEVAIRSSGTRWPPADPGRAASSNRTHGYRESPLGSKAHSGRVGPVRVSSFRQDRGQIYAWVSPSRSNRDMAAIPDASRIQHMGLRLFLRLDGPVPDASRLLRHSAREILHVAVTRHSTADWSAQQIVECCAWDQTPPRFLIHDRDSRYGMAFDRRVRGLGIRQVRTPFRAPRANAVAER